MSYVLGITAIVYDQIWVGASLIFLAFVGGVVSRILYPKEKRVDREVMVKRDGHLIQVLQTHIVPGDIVILEATNDVPCDIVVFS